jgi:hypothetical protein
LGVLDGTSLGPAVIVGTTVSVGGVDVVGTCNGALGVGAGDTVAGVLGHRNIIGNGDLTGGSIIFPPPSPFPPPPFSIG